MLSIPALLSHSCPQNLHGRWLIQSLHNVLLTIRDWPLVSNRCLTPPTQCVARGVNTTVNMLKNVHNLDLIVKASTHQLSWRKLWSFALKSPVLQSPALACKINPDSDENSSINPNSWISAKVFSCDFSVRVQRAALRTKTPGLLTNKELRCLGVLFAHRCLSWYWERSREGETPLYGLFSDMGGE